MWKEKNGDDFPIAFKFLSSETCRPQRPQRTGGKWAAHFCYVEALFDFHFKMKMEMDSYCNIIPLTATLPR